jgi:hypothetical protein
MNDYIVIPQQFVNKYNNGKLKIDVNQFNAVQTLDGRWVTSVNALNEFEAQFGTININKNNVQVVSLDMSDFPRNDYL